MATPASLFYHEETKTRSFNLDFIFACYDGGMFLSSLINIIAPAYCFSCRKIGRYICCRCASLLKYHDHTLTYSPGVSGHIRFFRYDGVFKNTLRGAKYFSVRQGLYDILTYVPWGKLPEALKTCDLTGGNSVLVPIPLHPQKLHERGFNQTEVIAAEISRRLSIPVSTTALVRTKYTNQQARLIHAERALNIYGAFAVKHHEGLEKKHIVLIDDVWTTGSTIREVVRTIHNTPQLTSNKIFALTLAR